MHFNHRMKLSIFLIKTLNARHLLTELAKLANHLIEHTIDAFLLNLQLNQLLFIFYTLFGHHFFLSFDIVIVFFTSIQFILQQAYVFLYVIHILLTALLTHCVFSNFVLFKSFQLREFCLHCCHLLLVLVLILNLNFLCLVLVT